MTTRTLTRLALAVLASGSLALGACTPDYQNDSSEKVDTADKVSAPASTTESSDATTVESPVAFTNAYVKAKPGDKKMTAIFGELTNTSDKTIHIVSFSTSLDAPRNEIHEVVDGVMKQREDGITIAPGETHVLKPGADHLMIMDFATPIEAGDTVDVYLKLESGLSITIKDVPVRTINSGEESYGSDGELKNDTGMKKMDHGDHMDKDSGDHMDHMEKHDHNG